ncbi:MAG: hypothetical protein ACK502_01130 [Alphaproteobacteria bacterium]
MYVVLLGAIAGNVYADTTTADPLGVMRKPAKPITVEEIKKMVQEAEHKLLTEEPKDARQAVMAVNKCIEKTIDQKAFQALNAQSRNVDKQVKELCKAGQEAEAKELQKQYALQFAASKEYQAMKACVDKYKMSFYDDAAFDAIRRSMARADTQTTVECKRPATPNS